MLSDSLFRAVLQAARYRLCLQALTALNIPFAVRAFYFTLLKTCWHDENNQPQQHHIQARREFRDTVLGRDFRKLFPLIEELPTGFDCSLLRSLAGAGAGAGAGGWHNGQNDDGNENNDNNNVVVAAAGGAADGDGAQRGAAGRNGIGGGARGQGTREAEKAGGGSSATWEEDIGGFFVTRMRSPFRVDTRSDLAVQVREEAGYCRGRRGGVV